MALKLHRAVLATACLAFGSGLAFGPALVSAQGRFGPDNRVNTGFSQRPVGQPPSTNQRPTFNQRPVGQSPDQGFVDRSRQPGGQSRPSGPVPRIDQPGASAPLPAGKPLVFKPDWADNLPPRHQQHLLQILRYWEYTGKQIDTYRCRFQRWEYDSVFGPRGDCKTYSIGELKYAKPDKGLFRVDKVMTYQPPEKEGGRPRHIEQPGVKGEHWVCDGRSIFEHDHQNRKLIQREIPKELQGTAIFNGPLPFMFGAKADEILSNYWIRVITPPSVLKKPDKEKQYWLEAYPKRESDAANYLKLHVIIDFQKYLPEGLVLFDRGYRPPYNDSRTVFRFDQRKVNFDKNILNIFMRDFYDVKTPSGWQRIVEPAADPRDASRPRTARTQSYQRRSAPVSPTR